MVVGTVRALDGMRRLWRRIARRSPSREHEPSNDDYERRIEAYRAALEEAIAKDKLDEDEPFIADLRERFSITADEDRILRYYARQATIPHREGDPDAAYERLRVLGQGGAGRTWLARDRARDRLVVLKEPLEKWRAEPAVLAAARRGARLAAKVDHPNVVDVERVLEDEGCPVLVMEHVTGGSLAGLLDEEGPLDADRTRRIGRDIARGLAAIHEAGIVHRDLSPANVLLHREGRAIVTDFGLARPTGAGATRLLDEDAGTEGYRAPEAARGSDRPSVDVYGLAAVLYACLHGHPPPAEHQAPRADVRDPLAEAIEHGLRADPDRRPDARAIADGLDIEHPPIKA